MLSAGEVGGVGRVGAAFRLRRVPEAVPVAVDAEGYRVGGAFDQPQSFQ